MSKFPIKLDKRLQKRKEENSLRRLDFFSEGVDFFSNDYLGLSKSEKIYDSANTLIASSELKNGATGSRLLSGNHIFYKELEDLLADFHEAEAALVFNSGYDANIGFFSAVPQKSDIILFDELSHASIRDGLQLSLARNYKFRHNDMQHLEELLKKFSKQNSEIYIVTESVFSMDGDSPDLLKLGKLAERFNARLVLDEAHATGVFGKKGEGLSQGMIKNCFARIYTFGKAIGCHGAAILGSRELKEYLVNFSRSLIYTTALSPHAVATVISAYRFLDSPQGLSEIQKLRENISFFTQKLKEFQLDSFFISANSAIQSCILSGNDEVKSVASEIAKNGFLVKPILSPTVPKGKERLRFCLHSYNSHQEISEVLSLLANFVVKN
ncbi:8-amino-7-oxononanoate synthase [Christiangramia fulva]|uniref:8-amino-7-oxononanoate synthase n=1 Tax=Christiangramia fulva TaxID=2126553 RepID=A0A2R3Z2N9_9FLAO|nr:pyridoxal phosphate-dependent aminotransferase family protein [Christiangramia fulva]AVR44516.1 8-amino-7-oxononanoate synthase [Christiangramia fulva]